MLTTKLFHTPEEAADIFMVLKPKTYNGILGIAPIYDILCPQDPSFVYTLGTLHSGFGPILFLNRESAEAFMKYCLDYGEVMDVMDRDRGAVINDYLTDNRYDCIYMMSTASFEDVEAIDLNVLREERSIKLENYVK